ncbi:unnamed protein product [Gordionus sp. m RMFG-2023]|uniref:small ribosomal subunit protein bS6m-like n=1 Tax=Gordionus sp. m RMFG-2023 TaxID=3053472 RepID=UPI0030E0D3FC
MPQYEISMILKLMNKDFTVSALKRVGQNLLKHKGIISNLENLGSKQLPYIMHSFNQKYKKGQYFIWEFYCPSKDIPDLEEELSRDIDIIRSSVINISKPFYKMNENAKGIDNVEPEDQDSRYNHYSSWTGLQKRMRHLPKPPFCTIPIEKTLPALREDLKAYPRWQKALLKGFHYPDKK